MQIKKTSWIVFICLAILGASIWFKFTFPQLSFINLSVNRTEAIASAKNFLASQNQDISNYKSAVVFRSDKKANRYLQKNLDIAKLRTFITTHNYDLFYWYVRFFKENEKEEYSFFISCKTGEILSYRHTIDENTAAPEMTMEEGTAKAQKFLEDFYQFDSSAYSLTEKTTKKWDNRSDFSFVWQKDDLAIPWSEEDASTAKLETNIKVTGDQVLQFTKNAFEIPDGFERFIKTQKEAGTNLMTIMRIINMIFIGIAVFYVVLRRNQLAMFTTKRFYTLIIASIFMLLLVAYFNQFQHLLLQYQTSLPFNSFFLRSFINYAISALITSVLIIMPSLAGESIHYESSDKKPNGSFLYYIRSTFFSRNVTQSILLGYLVCIILLGLQSLITTLGEKYCGVWQELTWMNNLSTAYFPFLAAFIIAIKASFSEELIYRLFTFNWLKKVGMSAAFAVIVSAIIWGFSHSDYPIFPTWFRGLEVTILGLFIGVIYIRYGLITVIVSHYLFNAFWMSAAYLFGTSKPIDFYTSIAICILPLVFALIAYIRNKSIEERTMSWQLNSHQTYNLKVLTHYLKGNWHQYSSSTDQEIIDEITAHGWDMAVVEESLKEIHNSE